MDSDLPQSLIPAVLCALSPEVKKATLCGGMYEYMTGRFGVRRGQGGRRGNRKRKKHRHERNLKMLTKDNNAAKKELG